MFSIDWDEWQNEWRGWKSAHAADLKPTRERFRGKNFLADDILGTWSVNGRTVELSEVVFPNLSERDENGRLKDYNVRAIGITYGIGAEGSGDVVHSFEELEDALGISHATV